MKLSGIISVSIVLFWVFAMANLWLGTQRATSSHAAHEAARAQPSGHKPKKDEIDEPNPPVSEDQGTVGATAEPAYAIVTMWLGGTEELERALAMFLSAKGTGSNAQLVLLTDHERHMQVLMLSSYIEETLGIQVQSFEIAKELHLNITAKYEKVMLWTMEQYDSIIYIDPNVIFINNPDSIFENIPTRARSPTLPKVNMFSADLKGECDSLPLLRSNNSFMLLRPDLVRFDQLWLHLNSAKWKSPAVTEQVFFLDFYSEVAPSQRRRLEKHWSVAAESCRCGELDPELAISIYFDEPVSLANDTSTAGTQGNKPTDCAAHYSSHLRDIVMAIRERIQLGPLLGLVKAEIEKTPQSSQ